MNSDIYIFVKLGTYYSQCPDDFTSEIFKKMGEWYSSANAWISVHRRGELMYYGYVCKLEADCYIGFCSVFNGVMVTDFDVLFKIFESMVTHLAVSGEILKYNDDGNLVSNAQSLVYGNPVLIQIKTLLKDGLFGLSTHLKKLPAESYGISMSENKQFDLCTDDMPTIVSASWNYSYTFIIKDREASALDSYQGILRRLHKEKKELEVTNSDLLAKIIKLKKEKKQQGVVFALGTATVFCFFILLGVKQSLDETQSNLVLSQEIQKNTQTELDNTRANFVNAKKKNEEMQSSFSNKMLEKSHEIFSLQKQNEQIVSALKNTKLELQQVQSDNRDLQNENHNLKITITQYKNKLSLQRKEQVSQNNNSKNIREATTITDASVRVSPSYTASVIKELKRGSTVEVVISDLTNGYYKVYHKNTVGYLPRVFLKFK